MARIVFFVALLTTLCPSQGEFLFPADKRDSQVPSPVDVLGHRLGERHTASIDALRYAEAVARASDRVVVAPMGKTWSGLSLTKVVITSARRHRDDPERSRLSVLNQALEKGQAPASELPVVLWFCMSIHGNEASGVEAGLAILHHLASSQDEDVTSILDRVVLCLELVANPDGRERFVQGVRDRRSAAPRPDRSAWDHKEPWPGGRTNHYLFDLNRDWFLQTQVESQVRAREFLRERPHVLCDFHEMGTDRTYYFSAPPGLPTNQHISAAVRETWSLLGDAISRRFDRSGWPYWVGDTFPADYPGYGGSWPCLFGAAGFTFEQASAGGGEVKRGDGSVHTLRESMERHAGAGWAVISAAASGREAILENVAGHFRAVNEAGAQDSRPWFVLTPRHDQDRLRRLHATLRRNGIRTLVLQDAARIEATPLTGGAPGTRTVPAGSVVVSTRQPLRPLVLALLDPDVKPEPGFVAAEEKRLAAGERSQIYDVTAWNLPLLFGVESFRAASLPDGVKTGDAFPVAETSPAIAEPGAWLVPGRRLSAARVLSSLLQDGVRVRVIPFRFTAAGRAFGPGTLLVLADRNRDEVRRAAIARHAADLIPVKSLRTPDGHDLGSGRTLPVKSPRVLLVTGPGTSAYSTGGAWWLLEQVAAVPHVRVGLNDLARSLDGADVVLLPDGRYDRLEKGTLEGFLSGGGTVVSVRGATDRLVELGLLPLESRKEVEGLGSVAGAIMNGRLDSRHWAAYGLPEDVAVQVRTSRYYAVPGKDVARTILTISKADGGVVSGILPDKKRTAIAGSPVFLERRHGRGRILSFTEDPAFRGTYPGLWRLLLNAILLGPSQES